MKKILVILTLLVATPTVFSQLKVTGKVVDNLSNIPLEYATVILKNKADGKVNGGISDVNGDFEITVQKGTYDISIEFISFQPKKILSKKIEADLNLGTIKLSEDEKTLDEVVIVAEKTTVDIRLDKKIYNIGKDLSVRGGNASDVLGNVPSVQVDVEGNVSLRGNENVTIFIDGRPSALVGINGATALRQIPAEAIERIEVITSPSARYDAEGTGGILNIILRKNKLVGFNGTFQVDLGYPERFGNAINGNYRDNKWNFFTNTGFRYNANPGNAFNDSKYFSQNAQNARVIEDRYFGRLGRSLFTSFGAEYFINDNSSIIANLVYSDGNDDDVNTNTINRFDSNGNLNESTKRTENESQDEERLQFTLDYINNFDGKGKKLSINAQISKELENTENNIPEINTQTNILNDLELVLEKQQENSALLQIDFVNPINEKIQIETGYRGNYRDIFNSFYLAERLVFPNGPLVPDTGLNNAFNYREFVNASYFQYGQKFNKISFLGGLRYEYTSVEIEQNNNNTVNKKFYGNLFPTVNIGIEFNENESLTLGYNKRIRRPRGRFLNPFPSRSSESNIFRGNVDLNPVISDVYEVGFLKKWDKFTISTSLYYNTSDDNWEFIQQETGNITDNGDPIIERFPINLSKEQRTGFEFTLTYKPIKAWTINTDFNIFNVKTTGGYTVPNTNQFLDFNFENTAFFARLNQKITLLKKIDMQINSNYRGGNRNAQSYNQGIFSMDLALSKDILNDKATISFNANDLLNSRKRMSETFIQGSFDAYSEFQWRERQFVLSFIYRFNRQKTKDRNERKDNFDNNEQDFGG